MFLDALVLRLHEALYRYPEALSYLKSRSLTDKDLKEYQIGYSKFVTTSNDGSEEYTEFKDEMGGGRKLEEKIVFPLFDCLGRVVGLLGRGIQTKEFKFFLTKEAKITGAFIGFYQALPSIHETKKVFVVEGPFDLIAFRRIFPNCVASVTAGMSDAQYDLLKFFADTVVTVFDSDKAGQRAREESAESWETLSVKLAYKDPDECLKVMGPKRFEQHVRDRVKQVIPF